MLWCRGKILVTERPKAYFDDEIAADPALQAMRFEIQILSAADLAKVNMFGTAPSSYVAVFWEQADEPGQEPQFKTATIASNTHPEYERVMFVLNKPDGKLLRDCCLRVVAYNKNLLKTDDFLGQLVLTGDSLADFLAAAAPATFDLQKGSSTVGSKQAIQGSLTLLGRPAQDDDEEKLQTVKQVPPGMKEMEVTIMAAAELAKANTFGLSDPFAIVR